MQNFDLAKARVQIYIDLAALDVELAKARSLIETKLPKTYTVKILADTSQFNAAIAQAQRSMSSGVPAVPGQLGTSSGGGWYNNQQYFNAQQAVFASQRNLSWQNSSTQQLLYNSIVSNYQRQAALPSWKPPSFVQGAMAAGGYPLAWLGPQFAAGYGVAGGAMAALKYGAATEQQLATLRIVTGMSKGGVGELYRGIQGIGQQLPVDTGNLLDIAAVGARAGVGEKDLLGFTKSMGKIELAIPEMEVSNLAEQMIRTLKLFGKTTDEIENLASAMKALDNATTASTKDIFLYTANIAGFANMAGISPGQTMAMGVLMREANLEPEMATSAMQRLLSKIVTDRDSLAPAAGMSGDQLATEFRKDPLQALGLLMKRMNQMSDSVDKIDYVKEALGLKNVRDVKMFTQLGLQWNRIPELTGIADADWKSKDAINRTADIQAQTLNAAVVDMTNSFKELGAVMASAFIPATKDLVNGLTLAVRGTTEFAKSLHIEKIGEFFDEFISIPTNLKDFLKQAGLWHDAPPDPNAGAQMGNLPAGGVGAFMDQRNQIKAAVKMGAIMAAGGMRIAAGAAEIAPEISEKAKESIVAKMTETAALGSTTILESLNSKDEALQVAKDQKEELVKIRAGIDKVGVAIGAVAGLKIKD